MAQESPIRVLIVDDSVMYRKILSDAVAARPEALLVGAVSSGTAALKKLAQLPVELVLLDVFMPDLDGLATLEAIRREFPDVAVVMISVASTRETDVTVQALEKGALDFIAKPEGDNEEQSRNDLAEELRRALGMVQVRRHTRGSARKEPASLPLKPPPGLPPPPPRPAPSSYELVVIGVSTGGPNALNELIPRLPADLGCPILLVQHMPPQFTASLASHLARQSALRVVEAREDEAVQPRTVYLAPGGRHMTLRPAAEGTGWTIGLNDTPPVHSCRPAVDVLFRSVAAAAHGGVLAVILTGMGEDGAAGVAALKRQRHCYCLAQDESTSVIYGMPRAVVDRGLADEVVPLHQMADRICSLIQPGRSLRPVLPQRPR